MEIRQRYRFEDVTDDFWRMTELLRPESYISSSQLLLSDALLVPEFSTPNLDFSHYLHAAFEAVRNIERDWRDYIPQDEDAAVILMCRDFVKLLHGAKVYTLFYHAPFACFLAALRKNDRELLRTLAQSPAIQTAILLLRSLTLLQIYYEAVAEHMEHGDDLQFYLFTVYKTVQDIAGDLDTEAFYTEQIYLIAKRKAAIMKLPLFLQALMASLYYIAGDNTKSIKVALNDLDAKFIYQLADGTLCSDLEKKIADYVARYYGQHNAALFAAFSDGQLSVGYDELSILDLATVLAETKRYLTQIVDNVQSIVNDSVFGVVNNALFALHFNTGLLVAKGGCTLYDELHLNGKTLQLHFSCCTTPYIVVSNDIYQFYQPFYVRLALLTLYYCQKDFVQQFIQNQLISLYTACSGKSIAPMNAGADLAKFRDFCGGFAAVIYPFLAKLVSAHAGRLDRIFRTFLKQKPAVEQMLADLNLYNDRLLRWMRLLIEFVFLEFAAVPYVTALLFSIINDFKATQHAFFVLRELTARSYIALAGLTADKAEFVSFIKNDNFQLMFAFISSRYCYCVARQQKYSPQDEIEFFSRFKAVIRAFSLQNFDTELCGAASMNDEQIKLVYRNPTALGVFMCYSKYSKMRLAAVSQLWQDSRDPGDSDSLEEMK